jgi:hypothetical protein
MSDLFFQIGRVFWISQRHFTARSVPPQTTFWITITIYRLSSVSSTKLTKEIQYQNTFNLVTCVSENRVTVPEIPWPACRKIDSLCQKANWSFMLFSSPILTHSTTNQGLKFRSQLFYILSVDFLYACSLIFYFNFFFYFYDVFSIFIMTLY